MTNTRSMMTNLSSVRWKVSLVRGERRSSSGPYQRWHLRRRRSEPRDATAEPRVSTISTIADKSRRYMEPRRKFQRTKWFTPSSMALLNATLFCNPVTTTSTSLLSSTVPTPTVSAILGTASMSLLKKRALARIVSYARVLTSVREARDDPSRWDDQSNGGGRG
jgi:hypothetical protein